MPQKVDVTRRKREIAKIALGLFAQIGYENVSFLMIAEAAKVARTAMYRCFRSKRDVMDAAIATVIAEIDVRSREALLTRDRASVRLERVCHAVADVMFREREFVIAVFDFVMEMVRQGEDMGARINLQTRPLLELIQRLAREAERCGDFPKGMNVKRIADVIYTAFESCAMRIFLGTECDSMAAKARLSNTIHAISSYR